MKSASNQKYRNKISITDTETIIKVKKDIDIILSDFSCPDKDRSLINVAVDEIVSNIVDYSGADLFSIDYSLSGNSITIVFEDDGVKFNPQESKAIERRDVLSIGGLGIHFVKEIMDEVSYEFSDNHNHLRIIKSW